MKTRLLLGFAGIALIAYGAFRLLSQPDHSQPVELAKWLIVAVLVHDGIFVPVTMAVGFVLTNVVRPRARRYLQGALIAAALVSVPAVLLIRREGTQDPAKALLTQNYGRNLAVILGVLAGGAILAYGLRVVRDQRVSRTNVRPSADHDPDQV